MQYAVRDVNGKWQRETAEHVLKIREKYGKESQEYKSIKNTFYCYGCYQNWREAHGKEPTNKDMPLLDHVDRSKSGGTHFRIRGSAKGRGENDHELGCRFRDPAGYLKNISHNSDCMDVDPKGIIRISILKRKQQKGKKKDRFGLGNPDHIGIQRGQSFGELQEICIRFDNAWTELSIRTEDDENVKIKDLLFDSSQALEEPQNHKGKIRIITGKVKKVESRNKGGYINIIFEREKIFFSPPFRLSISPNHIYNEDDLKCLENRHIGCYGRVNCNKSFMQMELFSLPNQIVFLDLEEDERCPFMLPSINYGRLKMVIDKYLEFYGALTSDADGEKFIYYLRRKENISLLEKQIQQIIIERKGLEQEEKYKEEEKENNIVRKDRLATQLNSKKDDLVSIRNSMEQQNSVMRRLFHKVMRRSGEINLIRSKEVVIEKEVMELNEEYYNVLNEIMEIENSIKHINVCNLNLQEEVNKTLREINNIKTGFDIEEAWREHLKNKQTYIYHNSSENLWISVDFKKSVSNSEIVQVTCVFQLHDKDNPFRISLNSAEIVTFNLRPNDEKVYETTKIELARRLKQLSILGEKKLINKS